MKIIIYKNKKLAVCIAVLLLAIGVIAGSSYVLLTRHTIPACGAITKVINYTQEGRIETALLVSVIPLGRNKVQILLNGQVRKDNEKYTVSRLLVADYQYQHEQYHVRVKQVVHNPVDNVVGDEVNRVMPWTAKDFFLKIEKVDAGNVIFAENNAPLFICKRNT